ncbi:MAG: hypothetical protein Q8Q62_04595 [Mesorhizobium sp.]|nr:hypothetical protein [Mesorhizobium sp.]
MAFAFYISVPIATAVRFQNWCDEGFHCAYLDSRLSYYGAVVAVIGIAAALIRLPSSQRVQSGLRSGACALLACLGGITYLHNAHMAADMRDYVSAWTRAANLACEPGATIPAQDEELLALIDPKGRVSRHPNFDIASYWRHYIEDRRTALSCEIPRG